MSGNTPDSPFAQPPEERRSEAEAADEAAQPAESPFAATPDSNAYAPPNTVSAAAVAGAPSDNGISTLVPYKNPPALIAYYLGLASLIPCLGFFAAVPAVILGFIGLKKRQENPAVHGTVHAWIGIVMGIILGLIWGVIIVVGIVAGVAAALDS